MTQRLRSVERDSNRHQPGVELFSEQKLSIITAMVVQAAEVVKKTRLPAASGRQSSAQATAPGRAITALTDGTQNLLEVTHSSVDSLISVPQNLSESELWIKPQPRIKRVLSARKAMFTGNDAHPLQNRSGRGQVKR
jgi:hypothetical protein